MTEYLSKAEDLIELLDVIDPFLDALADFDEFHEWDSELQILTLNIIEHTTMIKQSASRILKKIRLENDKDE